MNFKQIRKANELIDEIQSLDSLIMDIQKTGRTLKVSTNFNGVVIKNEHKHKIIEAILGIRREWKKELEKLRVTEE